MGSALLRLMAGHPAGKRFAGELDGIVLSGWVEPQQLANTIRDQRISEVIEVADVDTLVFSRICAELGVDYLCASVQCDREPTAAPMLRLLPGKRPEIRASHLIGAGMNPGIVNALVFAGLHAFEQRVKRRPDLYAIYVTEIDTTARADGYSDEKFAMSWSPRAALDELLEPSATYFARGQLANLPHPPPARNYAVRCGEEEIAAMVVPHEEVVTLGSRFPAVECAFLYAIPTTAAAALRAHPERKPEDWATARLYPPDTADLVGHDRVGVLLCSRDHGELWIGFDTQIADGARFGSNATLLQAATGVLAGWRMLGTRRGIHFVEDLDWRAYLAIVEDVLGPAQVQHDPSARVRTLAERVLPA